MRAETERLIIRSFANQDTFSPCWNFLPDYGGKGYAFEAAKAYFAEDGTAVSPVLNFGRGIREAR